ncbi:hypothetical protein ACP70R_004099 [Stipagrostis hirtigluma subsp. patula]
MAASCPTSLLPTPAPTPRLFRPTRPTRRPSLRSSPRKPPPLSCAAAAAAPAPAPASAAKAGSWRDLCSLNAWVVRDYGRLVASVGELEPPLRRLSDEQLKAKTAVFRARLALGETLADVQAEAFAIIGGDVLHDECIAEMRAGERARRWWLFSVLSVPDRSSWS